MASSKSELRGDVLVISITKANILDELLLRDIQRELLDTIRGTETRKIVVDFGLVEFLSSSALGMLIRCHKTCKDREARLKLCSIAQEIEKVFKMTGLHKILEIHRDAEAAIWAFDKGDRPGEAGVFAKLKPRPSDDAAAAEPQVDEE